MIAALLSTHDFRLFSAALAVGLLLVQTSLFCLPPRPAEAEWISMTRTALAGMILGGAIWVIFLLSLDGFFPFLAAHVPMDSAVMSIALAVAGGAGALAIATYGDDCTRNVLLSGSILSASVSCSLFVAMSGVAEPMVLGYALEDVVGTMVAGTLVCGFGLRRVARARSRPRLIVAATLLAVALPLMDIVSLASILPFTEWETASATPGALALRPLTVMFLSEFIAMLALTRAGSVVDRQSAARTQRENDRLRQLTESTFEGILVHRGGRVLDANSAFCAMVNLPLEDIKDRAVTDFATGFRGNTQGQPIEVELVVADGEAIPVEMLSRGISFGDGEAEVAAVRDIRERRAAENSKRDRQRVVDLQRETDEARERLHIAEEVSRAKSAFLAMMSHEIRTPMNAVLGLASSLLDDTLSTEQRQVVVAIHESGGSLLRILNDVLDFSRLDAGRMTFEYAPFPPATLTLEAHSVHGPRAVAKGLVMTVTCDPELPEVLVGDAGRIRQVLHNLVSNAIKFTDTGYVTVRACCVERHDDTATIEWVVTDSGIGIAPEKLGSLFDAFVQADDSITRRFGGSGLGLTISKQLAEQMGGGITAQSTPGEGSTFRFRLSLPVAAAQLQTLPDVHQTEEALLAWLGALDRQPRLLLAEDNPTNQFVFSRLLKRIPISVDIAHDGRQAVELAGQTAYDIIFMDLRMPEMDGLEAARLIRRDPGPCRDAPIVALTANAFAEDMAACDAVGMTDFVAKPVSRQRLFDAVLRGLQIRRTAAPPTEQQAA